MNFTRNYFNIKRKIKVSISYNRLKFNGGEIVFYGSNFYIVQYCQKKKKINKLNKNMKYF